MPSQTMSLTEFQANAARVLAEVRTQKHTVVLTQDGRPTAVVQDYDAHQRVQDAALMLKLVSRGEADIAAGRTEPQREVFTDIGARLKSAE